ncbi:prephenate/arogenate dehydrogenase family protein [Tropicibacter sp. R15_0]|uniref:prephenate/arogenate dehydrogenase family protein n=1 Tax=Tropicibacter sp. R15_0 TaxID=2821101 RepID=UPI001ADB88EF|nr:prephenate/arogenate dehydrogenase family protein [Tropicibacter sp. R15_0]MBO9464022.1 prephenate/arogenate dehydrogenase family protein [Tropicibacter sp. R15_0]
MSEAPFQKVALIGLGLIASSMFWAMKRAGMDSHVTGFARSEATRDTARRLGLCDQVCDSAEEAVKDADLVVLAVPVGAMGPVMQTIAPHLKPGCVVSEVGSVKRTVIDAVTPHLPEGVHFVPTHPMAGTEHSGPDAGFASLFDNRWCLIVPEDHTDADAVSRVETYWTALGANTERMDAEHHDMVCAVVSHIPHLIAYTMVGVADDLGRISDNEVIKFSAAGFRDFTRIAASDPTMWRDVFLTNKDATIEILGRFTEELMALQRAIRTGDGEQLHAYFTRTRAIRRSILEAGQDTDAPDFGRAKVDR